MRRDKGLSGMVVPRDGVRKSRRINGLREIPSKVCAYIYQSLARGVSNFCAPPLPH